MPGNPPLPLKRDIVFLQYWLGLFEPSLDLDLDGMAGVGGGGGGVGVCVGEGWNVKVSPGAKTCVHLSLFLFHCHLPEHQLFLHISNGIKTAA